MMLDLNNKKCKENQQQPLSEKVASHAFLRKFVFKSPVMATTTTRKMFQRRSNEKEVTRVAAQVEQHQQKSKAKRAAATTVLVQQEHQHQVTTSTSTSSSGTALQSPQEYLDTLLHSRGYSTQKFKALETAYSSKPTPLQAASFDPYLVSLFDTHGTQAFISVMKSGLSPNARHGETGESLVHCASQAGNDSLLLALLTLGSSVQVCDETGRTPLHAACMAAEPSVEVVDLLLSADPDLLCLKDVHDALPLSYVPQQHWAAWIEFLESKQDTLWSPLSQVQTPAAPALAVLPPNSHPLEDPDSATLPPELATMVAQGRINTFEAQYLLYDGENEFDTSHHDDDDFLDEDLKDDDDASDSSAMTFSDLLEGLSLPKSAYPKTKTTTISAVSRTVQTDAALSKQRLLTRA